MIRRVATAIAFVLTVATAACAGQTMHILFVGNSYTQRNDFPQLVERIAKSKGLRLKTEAVATGGATLKNHWDSGTAATLFRKSHFDDVVLQPQSSEIIRTPGETGSYAIAFADAITAAGAQAILFAPWHPAEFDRMKDRYRDGYRKAAAEAHARLAPVDAAWESAQAAGVQLYGGDGSHPNLAGSYLAACVFFSMISGADPAGAWHPNELSDETAAALQRAARDAVRSEPLAQK